MNTLLAELKALLEKHAPQERENYTRAQFCEAEGISFSTFHKLKRMGLAPEVKRLPGLALLRITHAARLAWHERMDQLALAEAQANEAKQAALVEKRREAGRKAAASPLHVSKRQKKQPRQTGRG
jgi:hypothetical protein